MKEIAASIVAVASAYLLVAQAQTQSMEARIFLIIGGFGLCLIGVGLLAAFGLHDRDK